MLSVKHSNTWAKNETPSQTRSACLRGGKMSESGESFLRRVLRKSVRHASRKSSVQGMATSLPVPKGWFACCQRCRYQGREFRIDAPSPYVVCMLMTDHVLKEHALECAFCFLKFAGFPELAEHVNEAHTEPEMRNSEYTKANREEREFFSPGREASQTGRGRLRSLFRREGCREGRNQG